jgi:hypothetical protein
MIKKLAVSVCLAAALAITGSPTFAHHGTAAFDTTKMITVTATMTDFQFINPHVQLYFDVKNEKGEVEHWQGELTAPNKLARAGWTKHSLKAGDQITITGYLLKAGNHSIWIQKLVGPDGQPLPLFEQ